MSDGSFCLPQRILILRNTLQVGENVMSDNVLVLSCSFAAIKTKARFHAHATVTGRGFHIEISDDLLALGASIDSSHKLGVCLKLKSLRVDVFFPMLEWFDLGRLITWPFDGEASRYLVIPFQGCFGKKYFEGPICHLGEGGIVRSYIPPALGWSLELPVHIGDNASKLGQSLTDRLNDPGVKSHNIRRSLTAAIRANLQNATGQSYRVTIPEFQLEYAILLVGLRIAIGDKLICTSLDEKDAQLPAWRRLCQHLNIFFGKSSAGIDTSDSIDLGQFLHLVPHSQVNHIAIALNHFGQVLPTRLINSAACCAGPK